MKNPYSSMIHPKAKNNGWNPMRRVNNAPAYIYNAGRKRVAAMVIKDRVRDTVPSEYNAIQKQTAHTTPDKNALAGVKNRMTMRIGNSPTQPIH